MEGAFPEGTLPYPWGTAPGLWKPLADHGLWLRAFRKSRHAHVVYEQAKQLLRRLLAPKAFSLSPDQTVELLVTGLGWPEVRDKISHQIVHHRGRAHSLERELADVLDSSDDLVKGPFDQEKLCIFRKDDGWFLSYDRLVEYLRSNALDQEQARMMAFACAPYTMLQRTEAPRFFSALVESYPGLSAYLLATIAREAPRGSTSRAETAKTPTPSTELAGIPEAAAFSDAPSATTLPPVSTEAAHASPSSKDLALELINASGALAKHWRGETVAQLQMVNTALRAAIEPIEAGLRELAELHRRCDGRLDRIKSSKLLDSVLEPPDRGNTSDSFDVRIARAQACDEALARLEASAEKVVALCERLGERPRIGARGQRVTAALATELLDAQSALAEKDLHEIVEQGRAATAAIDLLTARKGEFERLLTGSQPDQWVAMLRVAVDPRATRGTESAAATVSQDWDLGGIFAVLALAEGASYDLVATLLVRADRLADAGTSWSRWVGALSYASFSQLIELAKCSPLFGQRVAEALVASSFSNVRPDHLDYLNPFLKPEILGSATHFYERLVNLRRSGIPNPLDLLHSDAGSHDRAGAETHRGRLKDLAENMPGMQGNYHKLRVIARDDFFKPVYRHVAANDLLGAAKSWQELGSLEEKVRQCSEKLRGNTTELGDSHYSQTRKFVREFERELDVITANGKREQDPAADARNAIAEASRALRRSAAPEAVSLTKLIDGVLTGRVLAPHSDFGERCTPGADGAPSLETLELIKPIHTRSWSRFVRGIGVELTRYAEDRVLEVTKAISSPEEAVMIYLRKQDYLSAQQAAAEIPALRGAVSAELNKAFDPVREVCAEFEGEEAWIRTDDEIALWLADAREAIGQLNLAVAREAANAARARADDLRRERPLRDACAGFLSEAGLGALGSLAELQRRVEVLKVSQTSRRIHLTALQRFSGLKLSSGQASRVQTDLQRFDRPRRWPTVSVAGDLKMALDEYATFVSRRIQWAQSDPRTASLIQNLVNWVLSQLESLLSALPAAADWSSPFFRLASEIATCPDHYIASVVGSAPEEVSTVPVPVPTVSSPQKSAIDRSGRSSAELRREVVAELRESIVDDLPATTPAIDFQTELMMAVRRQDWPKARQISAALLRGQAKPEDQLNSVEVVHLVSRALEVSPGDVFIFPMVARNACLASLLGTDAKAYLRDLPAQLPARALVGVVSQDAVSLATAEEWVMRLADVLRQVDESSSSSAGYLWLSALLSDAGALSRAGEQLAGRIALGLWEILAHKESAKFRSYLLHILFSMRQFDALRFLARESRAIEGLLMACIQSIEQMEVDSELRGRIPQLAAALSQQAAGLKNTKAWGLLMERINPFSRTAHAEPVEIILDSDAADITGEEVILPLRLIPDPADLPESLRLELGGDVTALSAPISLEDEVLLKEKSITVRAARALLPKIAYRVTGRTIGGRAIDIRSSWLLQETASRSSRPLHEDEVNESWPGYSGDPVYGPPFHGRTRERAEIKRLLDDPVRTRSLMLLGQRRIGKTSLLRQVADMYPPRVGGLAAAFVDVSGMVEKRGQMAAALFDRIISDLNGKAWNHLLKQRLQANCGKDADFEQVSRKARGDPQALSSRLEAFVSAVADATRGEVSRIVFLIDEFDRFIGPMLAGGEVAQEANALMWQVRQVVQHSERVSFVLAGSGLQRILVDDYAQALFGSIQEVQVEPFQMPDDAGAIVDTFLPGRVRVLLSRPESVEPLTRKAWELSGGHPFFLSMLGYSAGLLSSGRMLSPVGLDRIVEAMLSGHVKGGAVVNSKKFFGHIFESLAGLHPHRQAAAKILLAHVAQRTTPDYPKLSVSEAMDAPDVRAIPEAERFEVLKALKNEGALRMDANSVRISIPLTAAALRQDAQNLIQEGAILLRSFKA